MVRGANSEVAGNAVGVSLWGESVGREVLGVINVEVGGREGRGRWIDCGSLE